MTTQEDILVPFDQVASFEIDHDICLISDICEHNAKIHLKDGTTFYPLVNGIQAAHLYSLFNQPIPFHFKKYQNQKYQILLTPLAKPSNDTESFDDFEDHELDEAIESLLA
jgi:hypothetical protein